MTIWVHNGKILVNASGQVINSATCCCSPPCLDCSRLPSSIILHFTGEPSNINTPSGWIGAWELLPTSTACCYELDAGLPCTATKLTACIVSTGDDPFSEYQLLVKATYPSAVEGFTAHIAASGKDCVANGNGSPYSVGIGPSTGGPCNFINLLTHPSYVTITSNP